MMNKKANRSGSLFLSVRNVFARRFCLYGSAYARRFCLYGSAYARRFCGHRLEGCECGLFTGRECADAACGSRRATRRHRILEEICRDAPSEQIDFFLKFIEKMITFRVHQCGIHPIPHEGDFLFDAVDDLLDVFAFRDLIGGTAAFAYR